MLTFLKTIIDKLRSLFRRKAAPAIPDTDAKGDPISLQTKARIEHRKQIIARQNKNNVKLCKSCRYFNPAHNFCNAYLCGASPRQRACDNHKKRK